MAAKYMIPKALGPVDSLSGSAPGNHRVSTGSAPGYYRFSEPALRFAVILHFHKIDERLVLVDTVHGFLLHEYVASTPGTPLLAVSQLTRDERSRLLASFHKQDTGDHRLYKLTGAVYQYLKRHGANVTREESEEVKVRYSCTCSHGFTRVYRLDGKVGCQKCGLSTGLTALECKT